MHSPSFALYTHDDRTALGSAAARSAAATLRSAIAAKGRARMVAAAAPSQQDVYRALTREAGIDWSRVTILHMDEYLDLPAEAPQRFGQWLQAHLIADIETATFHPLRTELGADVAIAEYRALLAEGPIDLVCLGIGVNGHIAFNDPPDARLDDSEAIRSVHLDEASRVQQVDDECFDTLSAVPREALTLTIPALMAGAHLVCAVPGAQKAPAVRALMEQPVGPAWPCTVLRRHPRVEIHIDAPAASLLGASA